MNTHTPTPSVAKNAVTGEYWDGHSFCTRVEVAKRLTVGEAAVIRATYDNVVIEPPLRYAIRKTGDKVCIVDGSKHLCTTGLYDIVGSHKDAARIIDALTKHDSLVQANAALIDALNRAISYAHRSGFTDAYLDPLRAVLAEARKCGALSQVAP